MKTQKLSSIVTTILFLFVLNSSSAQNTQAKKKSPVKKSQTTKVLTYDDYTEIMKKLDTENSELESQSDVLEKNWRNKNYVVEKQEWFCKDFTQIQQDSIVKLGKQAEIDMPKLVAKIHANEAKQEQTVQKRSNSYVMQWVYLENGRKVWAKVYSNGKVVY